MLEENGSITATGLLCLKRTRHFGYRWRDICHKKDKHKKLHGGKETTGGNAWKESFEALFETLQLKLSEMFYHKFNFSHSFKLLT